MNTEATYTATTTKTHTSIEANTLVVNYLGENWTPNLDSATELLISNTVTGIADLEEKIIDRAHLVIRDMNFMMETIALTGSVTNPDDWAGDIQIFRDQRSANLSFLNCILHAFVQDN